MISPGVKLNVGVVGLGKMGVLHASILSAIPSVKVVALCEKSAIVGGFAHRLLPEVHVTSSLRTFADLRLDAVFVTTPIPTHYEIVREVVSDGIARNVFTEKTLTSSHDESQDLCQLAGPSLCTMVGYHRRYAVTFNRAKALLQTLCSSPLNPPNVQCCLGRVPSGKEWIFPVKHSQCWLSSNCRLLSLLTHL